MNKPAKSSIPTLILLFILSGSGLGLEVSLTRLFSFIFTHNYVYLIISLCMAGIGIGAVLNSIVREERKNRLFILTAASPPLMLAALMFLNKTPAGIYISIAATLLIFISIGVFQTMVFKLLLISPGKIYAADLSGAAAGSVVAYFILNLIGGQAACILFSLTAAVSCTVIYQLRNFNRRAILIQYAALSVAAVLLFLLSMYIPLLPPDYLEKEMTLMLGENNADAEIVDTEWSAFGRVDLVETDNPFFKTMFIDGAAGTKMIEMRNGKLNPEVEYTLLNEYAAGIPLLGIDNDRKNDALIIGSGGGIDVVTAMAAGYRDIDAVEINPDFIHMVRAESEYNGGIYDNYPHVNIINGEGRSFVRAAEKKYDLILMSLPIIKSARNYSNQAMTENYLFTHNAFSEYLSCLKEDGIIVILAHYPNELLKLALNAAAAITSTGVSSEKAMKHIITIGRDNAPVLLLKRNEFSVNETRVFYTLMAEYSIRGSTNFIPGFSQRSKSATKEDGTNILIHEFHPGLYALSTGVRGFAEVNRMNDENIGVVNDDSPFFYQMSKLIPSEISIVAVTAVLLLGIFLVSFLKRSGVAEKTISRRSCIIQFVSIGLIGLGFIFIEIAFIQKFIFFWKHQTLALTIVLSIILVSSGIGSFFAERIFSAKKFLNFMILLLILLVINLVFAGRVLEIFENYNIVIKFLLTFIILGPVFFIMGLPFAFLLNINNRTNNSRKDYPWLIGFNSAASLAGGVFSMITAMLTGYFFVMVIGIASYLVFSILTYRNTGEKFTGY